MPCEPADERKAAIARDGMATTGAFAAVWYTAAAVRAVRDA